MLLTIYLIIKNGKRLIIRVIIIIYLSIDYLFRCLFRLVWIRVELANYNINYNILKCSFMGKSTKLSMQTISLAGVVDYYITIIILLQYYF